MQTLNLELEHSDISKFLKTLEKNDFLLQQEIEGSSWIYLKRPKSRKKPNIDVNIVLSEGGLSCSSTDRKVMSDVGKIYNSLRLKENL